MEVFYEATSTKPKALIFIAFLLSAVFKQTFAATLPASLKARGETHLFAVPDESSEVVTILKPGDEISPLAETLVGQGARWYLVKAKNGNLGWVKPSDTGESKQLETFFKSLPAEPSLPLSTIVPSSVDRGFPANTVSVPVVMNGTSVIVPVTFNGVLRSTLALDTGATISVVSPRIANDLSIRASGTSKIGTVGGIITAPMARLESLKVGDAEVRDLVVAIHNFSIDPRIEGLLGLDFLKHFHVSLDARHGRLILGPR